MKTESAFWCQRLFNTFTTNYLIIFLLARKEKITLKLSRNQ